MATPRASSGSGDTSVTSTTETRSRARWRARARRSKAAIFAAGGPEGKVACGAVLVPRNKRVTERKSESEPRPACTRFSSASTAEVASWVASLASASLQSRQSSLEALDRVVVAPVVKVTAPPRSRVPVLAAVVALALVTAGAALFWPRPNVVEAPRAVVTTPPPTPTPEAPPKDPAPEPEPVVTVKPKPVAPKKLEVDRCNPPFTIDANGVKQFKVECLK